MEPARHVVLPAEVQVVAPGRNTLVVSGAAPARSDPPG
jgi:GntR family transcriptional regulator of arabinose operon